MPSGKAKILPDLSKRHKRYNRKTQPEKKRFSNRYHPYQPQIWKLSRDTLFVELVAETVGHSGQIVADDTAAALLLHPLLIAGGQ